MQAVLADLVLVFNQCLLWVEAVVSLIVRQPVLLLMVVAMPVIGYAVSLLRRIIGTA